MLYFMVNNSFDMINFKIPDIFLFHFQHDPPLTTGSTMQHHVKVNIVDFYVIQSSTI